MKTNKSAFDINSWDESEDDKWRHGKLSRTKCSKVFKGTLEGEGDLEAIMLRVDEEKGIMAYVGVECISGVLDGREGTFILVHTALSNGDEQNGTWTILPGSGTGELEGIKGEGSISPDHNFTLNYELDA